MNIDEYIHESNLKIINEAQNTDTVDPITKIMNNLYLGQGRITAYATILEKIGITHIVSIGRTPYESVQKESFCKFELHELKDNIHENLSIHFPKIFNFIRKAIKNNGIVFIHCEMGISRSPTIMIAFLRANGYFNSLQEAYDYVKQKRPWIAPNIGFKKQLQIFFSEKII